MKEYFSKLSQDIKKIITKNAPKCKVKEFEHLEEDGAVRDPKHAHVLFEDKTIRVIDVNLPSKEEESFHRHERASVMYTDMPASIEFYELPQSPNEISWSSTNPTPRFNIIPFEDMHKVKNVDDWQYRAFRIEFCADIMKLPNQASLLNQILTLIESQKYSLDFIRQQILLNETPTKVLSTTSSKAPPTPEKSDPKQAKIGAEEQEKSLLLNDYPAKRKAKPRESEGDVLRREAENFMKLKRG